MLLYSRVQNCFSAFRLRSNIKCSENYDLWAKSCSLPVFVPTWRPFLFSMWAKNVFWKIFLNDSEQSQNILLEKFMRNPDFSVYGDIAPLIHVQVGCGCFRTSTAALSSCDADRVVCTAENTKFLAPYTKSWGHVLWSFDGCILDYLISLSNGCQS